MGRMNRWRCQWFSCHPCSFDKFRNVHYNSAEGSFSNRDCVSLQMQTGGVRDHLSLSVQNASNRVDSLAGCIHDCHSTVVAANCFVELDAGVQSVLGDWFERKPLRCRRCASPLIVHDRPSRIKTHVHIEAVTANVCRDLEESHSGFAAPLRGSHYCLHQKPSHPAALRVRLDSDWTNSTNIVAHRNDIAANNLTAWIHRNKRIVIASVQCVCEYILCLKIERKF
mmetsp:Transcript_28734/g.66289  ORF Transcript_28734/g.66289 Transcript_28734/m.66289 type:complete len:225 (+) Transcript_28734:191-865(+)